MKHPESNFRSCTDGRRRFELIWLFGLMPLLLVPLGSLGIVLVVPALAGWAVACAVMLRSDCTFAFKEDHAMAPVARHWRWIFCRFIVGAVVLSVAVYCFVPSLFLRLPLHRPRLWLVVVLLYPLLSVYPQELVFRAYFFHRYRRALPLNDAGFIGLNALLFGMSHAVFLHWAAMGLSALGGALFAWTYLRTRSLLCVVLEHALWGGLVFTIGLDVVFGGGTIAVLVARVFAVNL